MESVRTCLKATEVSNRAVVLRELQSCTGETGVNSHRNPLYLQRTLGNQAFQRYHQDAMRPDLKIGGPGHDHGGVIRRQASSRCALSSAESTIKTAIEKPAPSGYYGASFNHIFTSDPEGCSLAGVQVSEFVTVQRDDFRQGMQGVALGRKIWTLTSANKLNEPDRIWTQAGLRGLGVNPLRNWPAVLEHNQLWYYRFGEQDRDWKLGPGFVLKVTLQGDRTNKDSLKVTTTDHGVSREESYRGPAVRVQ